MTDYIHTLTHIRTYRSDILLPGAYFEMRSSPGGILGMGLCLLVVWPVKQYPIPAITVPGRMRHKTIRD